MKPDRKKLSYLFYTLLAGYVAWRQIPVLLSNHDKEGLKLAPASYKVINGLASNEEVTVPAPGNSIIIFWATWCGPCKIEMDRLKSSVEAGEIPERSIIAVSASENHWVIRNFLKKNPYPFLFLEARDLARALDVKATPTTVFLENGTVSSMSTGLSIIGIWKAERFL